MYNPYIRHRLGSLLIRFDAPRGWPFHHIRPTTLVFPCGTCFLYRVASVVLGIVFFVGAVVGDALDDFFGIIAAGESPHGVRPIPFGLRPLPKDSAASQIA